MEGGEEVFVAHMGVPVGGGDAGVAQKLLDHSEIGSVLEEMSGEAVAEGVG